MDAKITEIIDEAENIKSFRFTPQEEWQWLPGQWMYLRLSEELKHTFTISSSPTEGFLQVTTMFRSQSEFKQTLFSKKVGDTVDVSGPHGSFVLDEADNLPRLFLAGGIGITPFHSMIKYSMDKNLNLPITLLYSAKTLAGAAFAKWLTDLKAEKLNINIIESEKEGHVDEGKIKQLVSDYQDRTWWVCGPAAFVDAMKELATHMGMKEEQVKSEDFPGY